MLSWIARFFKLYVITALMLPMGYSAPTFLATKPGAGLKFLWDIITTPLRIIVGAVWNSIFTCRNIETRTQRTALISFLVAGGVLALLASNEYDESAKMQKSDIDSAAITEFISHEYYYIHLYGNQAMVHVSQEIRASQNFRKWAWNLTVMWIWLSLALIFLWRSLKRLSAELSGWVRNG